MDESKQVWPSFLVVFVSSALLGKGLAISDTSSSVSTINFVDDVSWVARMSQRQSSSRLATAQKKDTPKTSLKPPVGKRKDKAKTGIVGFTL